MHNCMHVWLHTYMHTYIYACLQTYMITVFLNYRFPYFSISRKFRFAQCHISVQKFGKSVNPEILEIQKY